MLPKSRRLNLKKDFKWVSSGKRLETASFKLFSRGGENKNALVGIALSGQFFKKAHQRNRARRIISKAVEDIYYRLNKNINLVIMPKGAVLEKTNEQIKDEISKEADSILSKI